MYKIIVLLPLLGALFAMPLARIAGAKGAEYLTCTFMVVAAVLSWVAFYDAAHANGTLSMVIPIATWINSGDFVANWALKIDTLTIVMLVVVNSISCLVHIYSIGYMHHDPHRPRFFAYLSLFTFAMLMLVTASNFIQLFFGWEGVGLASYLLIGFWYQKETANAASIKAFVVNRVGDFGFALGIFTVFLVFGSVNFDDVFARAPEMVGTTFTFLSWEVDALTVMCLLLFMGACGKSAQLFLHTWLPDAMEGPTPVSALIHAATMVTAGVYLVCRCSPLFEMAPDALAVVTVIGASTAFFAATVGLFQNDIKRVIAYSTCSQLGYMFFAAGVGAYPVAMFHLFTHAFFKALLFLGAGSVIHAMSDEQDMTKMGGIYKLIPATWLLMIIGNLALTGVGIPHFGGFAGFYSKDAVIEVAYAAGTSVGMYAFWLGVFAALLTAFYSWRLTFMTFHGKPKASNEVLSHVHDSPASMMVPLVLLAIGAIFAGFAFNDLFLPHHIHEFWGDSIYIADLHHGALAERHAAAEAHPWIVWAPLIVTISGFGIAWYYYMMRPELPPKLAANDGMLYGFLKNKWYFDEIYDFLIVRNVQRLGTFLWKKGDGWFIDGFGPDGISAAVLKGTQRVVKLQSGYVYHYAFAMLIGIAVMITYFSYFALQGGLN